MLTILAEMVVDVLQPSRASLGVPFVLSTCFELRGVCPVAIVGQWPLRFGDTEAKFAPRAEYPEALEEQERDGFGVVEVLKAVFREDHFAAVRIERQAQSEIKRNVPSRKHIYVQESRFTERAGAQVEFGRLGKGLLPDLPEPGSMVSGDGPFAQECPKRGLFAGRQQPAPNCTDEVFHISFL